MFFPRGLESLKRRQKLFHHQQLEKAALFVTETWTRQQDRIRRWWRWSPSGYYNRKKKILSWIKRRWEWERERECELLPSHWKILWLVIRAHGAWWHTRWSHSAMHPPPSLLKSWEILWSLLSAVIFNHRLTSGGPPSIRSLIQSFKPTQRKREYLSIEGFPKLSSISEGSWWSKEYNDYNVDEELLLGVSAELSSSSTPSAY